MRRVALHQHLRSGDRRHIAAPVHKGARAHAEVRAAALTIGPAWGLTLCLTLCVTVAIGWLAPAPARAADAVAVDAGGTIVDDENPGSGMPRSNPRVKPILAAHPDANVVVCVAGCGGKSRAVQILPRMVSGRTGTFVPSAARMGDSVYGPPRPGASGRVRAAAREDDVVCIAGCAGKPGQVVQRLPDLPARTKPAVAKSKSKDDGILDFLP
jgi:hypothetical protein